MADEDNPETAVVETEVPVEAPVEESLDDMDILDSDDSEEASKATKEDTEDEDDEDSEETTEDDSEKVEASEDEREESEKKVFFKSIKEKYPNFFKDFPDMRAVIGREKDYSRVFPTVDDARIAVEKVEVLDQLTASLDAGEVTPLLATLHSQNPKVIEQILPTIQKHDPQTFLKITTPLFATFLRNAIIEGTKNENKNLILAAKHLSKYVFDNPIPPANKKEEAPQEDPEKLRLANELRKRDYEIEDGFINDVRTTCENKVRLKLERRIDPENTMTPSVRKAVAEQALQEVKRLVHKDKRLATTIVSLLKSAAKEKFKGDEWKPRIVSAYLGRAKDFLPQVVKNYSTGTGKPTPKGVVTKRIPQTGGSSKGGSVKVIKHARDIPRNMTDEEFLAQD